MFGPVTPDLARLEDSLRDSIAADPPPAADPMGDLFAAGGKRLRPALVLLCANLGEYEYERALPGAMAVELLHGATLVHDDVIDRSAYRRGRPTVVARAGEATAVLVGDFYFSKAYHEAARTGKADVVRVLTEAVMEIVDGELGQQAARYRYRPAAAEYLRRIDLKTGTLMRASCEIGAILGGVDAGIAALKRYGSSLGRAFQIVDDVLDYAGEDTRVGKPVGHDLVEGSATLPLILAVSNPSTGPRLERLLEDGKPLGAERVAEIVRIVRSGDAIEGSRAEARRWADEAKSHLADFAGAPAAGALSALADYIIERNV